MGASRLIDEALGGIDSRRRSRPADRDHPGRPPARLARRPVRAVPVRPRCLPRWARRRRGARPPGSRRRGPPAAAASDGRAPGGGGASTDEPRAPGRPDPRGLPGRRRQDCGGRARRARCRGPPRPRRGIAIAARVSRSDPRRPARDTPRVIPAGSPRAGPSPAVDARGRRRGARDPSRRIAVPPLDRAALRQLITSHEGAPPQPPSSCWSPSARRQPVDRRGGPRRPTRALGRLTDRASGADGRGQGRAADPGVPPRASHPRRRRRTTDARRSWGPSPPPTTRRWGAPRRARARRRGAAAHGLDGDLAAGVAEAVAHGFVERVPVRAGERFAAGNVHRAGVAAPAAPRRRPATGRRSAEGRPSEPPPALRIRHEIIAAALDADLLPGPRRRMHAVLAAVLADHPAEASRHWHRAHEATHELERTIVAAAEAEEIGAAADALVHLERAIELAGAPVGRRGAVDRPGGRPAGPGRGRRCRRWRRGPGGSVHRGCDRPAHRPVGPGRPRRPHGPARVLPPRRGRPGRGDHGVRAGPGAPGARTRRGSGPPPRDVRPGAHGGGRLLRGDPPGRGGDRRDRGRRARCTGVARPRDLHARRGRRLARPDELRRRAPGGGAGDRPRARPPRRRVPGAGEPRDDPGPRRSARRRGRGHRGGDRGRHGGRPGGCPREPPARQRGRLPGEPRPLGRSARHGAPRPRLGPVGRGPRQRRARGSRSSRPRPLPATKPPACSGGSSSSSRRSPTSSTRAPTYQVAASLALWRGDLADAERAARAAWDRIRDTEDWPLAARSATTVLRVAAAQVRAAGQRQRSRGDLGGALVGGDGARATPSAWWPARTCPTTRPSAGAPRPTSRRPGPTSGRCAAPTTLLVVVGGRRSLAGDRAAVRRGPGPLPRGRGDPCRRRRRAAPAATAASMPARPCSKSAAIAVELGAVPLLRALVDLAERARIELPARRPRARGVTAGGRPPRGSRPRRDGAAAPAGAAGGRGPGCSFGLSPREQGVLAEIVAGRTNREIGERLFISEKTVGVHVGNILAKLGVGGRVEAATVALRLGLVDDRLERTKKPGPGGPGFRGRRRGGAA